MVEFTVALIVIVMLLAGLVQLGQLTAAHSRTMTAARAAAAEAAMDTAYTPDSGAQYLGTWLSGSDSQPYTRDDIPWPVTNPVPDTRSIVNVARPDELRACVPDNAVSMLGAGADPLDFFYLVRGQDLETCATTQAFQRLAYRRETISVSSEVWLVWTEEIY